MKNWEKLMIAFILLVISIVFMLSILKVESVVNERYSDRIKRTESMSIPRASRGN